MRMLTLASVMWLIPIVAGAQTTDPKWNAWLGCWDLVLENARESATRPGQPAREQTQRGNSTRPQVCVQPAGAGVTFSTRVGTQTPVEQTVIADGVDRPIVDADCRGTERAEWSRSGRGLFSKADLSCAGDRGSRRVSGMAILGANGTWTDIQVVDIGGQETVRVRRYRRVSEGTQATRSRAGAPLTIDDVKEAGSKVSPRALEAALVETGSTFELSGRELIALQEAGVPSSVTDLMIALSYPDRFVVRTERADRAPSVPFLDDPFFLGWAFGYPMWSDTYGFYSPLYGRYSPYFYSPFSYSYLGGYDPRYFGGSSVIVIGDGGGSGGSVRSSGAGRVVDGQGYTRVRPRDAEVTSTSASSAGSSSSGGGSSSSSSSGGGGGSVSSQGFSSSGSGGGDGGRTAQPR